MSSIKRKDPLADHIALGASNEELEAQQKAFDAKVARGEACRVSVTSDREDKRIDGDGDENWDPLIEADPMRASIHPYVEPGKAYKLLSERCCDQLGGTRGYQIVKDENGDPVKLGNMIWGSMPEKLAKRRREALEKEDREKIAGIQNTQADQIERIISQGKDLGLTVLRPGDAVHNIGDGGSYDMGITVERGDSPSK